MDNLAFRLGLNSVPYVKLLAILGLIVLLSCGEKESKLKEIDFIIDWEPGIDYIGYYVADGMGFYQEQGINVSFKHVNGAPLSAQLIGTGKSIIGTTTADQLILGRTRQKPEEKFYLKAVATIFHKNPVVIFSLSDDPIYEIKDIEGKKLGMNAASVTYKQYRLIAQEERVNSNKVTEIDIGWGGNDQLLNGQIDALLAYTMERPVALQLKLEEKGDTTKVIRLKLSDYLNIIGQIIAVYEPSLSIGEKRDNLRKITYASLLGWEFAMKNKDKALDIFYERYPEQKLNKPYAELAFDYTMTLVNQNLLADYLKREDWEVALQAMKDMGEIQSSALNVEDFYENLDLKLLSSP